MAIRWIDLSQPIYNGMPQAGLLDAPQLTAPDSKPGFWRSCWEPVPQLAVKFTPVALGPRITDRDAGEKVQPDLLGITVYVPAARPVIV